jgi:hypothetical protein
MEKETERLLAMPYKEVTEDDSATIKRLIRQRSPRWEQLMERFGLEADEVYRESLTPLGGTRE